MMKIFAIIDRKAKYVVATFTALSEEAAKRSFISVLTGPDSVFSQFPGDFELYYVCDLAYDSGVTVSKPGNENIKSAGFEIGTFNVHDPIDAGADYDKPYLKMLHDERLAYNAITKPEVNPDDE